LSGKLGDKFSLNVQVGQIDLKTKAVLTTRNVIITSNSTVTNDYSVDMAGAADLALSNPTNYPDFLTKFSNLIRRHGQATELQDLGTFSRKQEQKLKNTIVNVSVGYNF
jgi:hypothetical protein